MRLSTMLLAVCLCAGSVGCSSAGPHVGGPTPTGDGSLMITDPAQREAAVGQRVTIVGLQSRTKITTVCGVDVNGDDTFSDQKVVARGILRRREEPPNADLPMTQNRGTTVSYQLIDPDTQGLARTLLHQ